MRLQFKLWLVSILSSLFMPIWAQNVYSPTKIQDIRLFFSQKDWDRILDSTKMAGSDKRLMGKLVLNGQKYEAVGVRYKGNSSFYGSRRRSIQKLPLNIKLEKGQKIDGQYETLKLSNINRDASFLREVLSYEIVNTYMTAPQCNFARVYVNDKYLGFYNNVESIDGLFTKKRLHTEGYLVKCDPEWTSAEPSGCVKGDKASLMYLGPDSTCYAPYYEIDQDGYWSDFIQFIRILNQEPEKLDRYLNIDQTLWMLALNNVMVNLDSYNGLLSHNYYLVKGSDQRLTPIMWDLNLSLGGFTSDASHTTPLSMEQMIQYQPLKDIDNPKRPLISQIMKNNIFRHIYIAHMRTILNDWFVTEKYIKRAKEWTQIIDNEVNNDKNKHYSYDDYKKNWYETVGQGDQKIVGIEPLMKGRVAFLQQHPLLKAAPPQWEGSPNCSYLDDKLSVSIKVQQARRVYFCWRPDPQSAFKYVPMFDDGQHNDGQAGDGQFGVVLDKKTHFQYYFIADNDDAASLLPERASTLFFEQKP